MASIENRPEGWVVVDGARVIPADDKAHAEHLLEQLVGPRTRVKVLDGKLRVDNGRGVLRPGEVVLFDAAAESLEDALRKAATHEGAATCRALDRYRVQS